MILTIFINYFQLQYLEFLMCPGRESNPHKQAYSILSAACIPFHHLDIILKNELFLCACMGSNHGPNDYESFALTY